MSHTYKFDVAMSCGGCSGAIERVLKKLDGLSTPPAPLSQRSARATDTTYHLK